MPSYEKNKTTGYWSCRYYGTDENGIPKHYRLSGRFKTKKDAVYAYEDMIEQQRQRDKERAAKAILAPPDVNEMLFEDLCIRYVQHKNGLLKEASVYEIKNRIKNRIDPFFKGKTINDVTPLLVSEWLSSMSEYSYKYRMTLFTLLCSILSFGNRYYDTNDISNKFDKPRNHEIKKEMSVWTVNEFNAFISSVDDVVYRTLFWAMFVTGARMGEVLALEWTDIDFGAGTMRIEKSYSYKSQKVTSPKNDSSNRTLQMPEYFMSILKEYREWFNENVDSGSLLFLGDKVLPENTIRRRKDQYADAAGVKQIRIHDFRHSCATLLLRSGVQIVAVSRYLGHANVTQTLNTYGHTIPDDQSMIKNALNLIQNT